MRYDYDLTYKCDHVGYPICGVYRTPDGRYRAFDGKKRSNKIYATCDAAERWLSDRMRKFRDIG